MKIRLQEIEFGVKDPDKSKSFYKSVLGLETTIDQDGLKVFNTGISGVDFNISTHLSPGIVAISFVTDDLPTVMDKLDTAGVSFEGPKKSHLGMTSIAFNDQDGYVVKVNQPGKDSPAWLKV